MAALYLNLSRCISSNAVLSMKRPFFPGELPPKRPTSAFGLFVRDSFHKDGIVSDAPSRLKALSQMWKTMDLDEKRVYIEEYNDRKSAYYSVKESFMNSMDDSERKRFIKYQKDRQKYASIRKQKKEGVYDPFPRKLSGFIMYMKETMAKTEWTNSAEKRIGFIQASQDWKNLSQEEKEMYNNKAELDHAERLKAYHERQASQSD